MSFFSSLSTSLNQTGLVFGFFGTILIACSTKIGVISKNGSAIFFGLDPMDAAEVNVNKVRLSHWRNRFLRPLGWILLSISFLLQFIATLAI